MSKLQIQPCKNWEFCMMDYRKQSCNIMKTFKAAGLLQAPPPSLWNWHWVAHPQKKITIQFWRKFDTVLGTKRQDTGVGFLQILERRAAQTKTKNSQMWVRGSMMLIHACTARTYMDFYHPGMCCDSENMKNSSKLSQAQRF